MKYHKTYNNTYRTRTQTVCTYCDERSTMYNNDTMGVYAKVLILTMKMSHNVLFNFPCVMWDRYTVRLSPA